MELASATMVAQQAILQQNVALSVIKQAAEQQNAIIAMLEQMVPAGSRGANVNLTA
ncbi:MAG: hypothetical protein ACK4VI_07970 [Alphaproteobacteria bacterium]